MSLARRLTLAGAAALAALTLAGATLALVALNNGGTAGAGPLRLRLAAGYDRSAVALAAEPGPARLDEAAAAARAAIALYPYDMQAWLSLIYIDYRQHGGLTPHGVQLLRQSYNLIPIDRDAGVWRVQFALEHYPQLPEDLRTEVREEVRELWFARKKNDLQLVIKRIQNPVGHLAAALWVQSDELRQRNDHKAPLD